MVGVIVYSAPNCPWCERAKEFLKEKSVKFKEIDVAENEKGQKDLIKKSGQMSVPVIDIYGKIVVGFNKPLLKKLLKIK